MNKIDILEWVLGCLFNDESSTDKEMCDNFIKQGKLTQEEAEHYVSQRYECLNNHRHLVKHFNEYKTNSNFKL